MGSYQHPRFKDQEQAPAFVPEQSSSSASGAASSGQAGGPAQALSGATGRTTIRMPAEKPGQAGKRKQTASLSPPAPPPPPKVARRAASEVPKAESPASSTYSERVVLKPAPPSSRASSRQATPPPPIPPPSRTPSASPSQQVLAMQASPQTAGFTSGASTIHQVPAPPTVRPPAFRDIRLTQGSAGLTSRPQTPRAGPTSRPQAKAKTESLAAEDADWFRNTQADDRSSGGGSPRGKGSQKGWKGRGRGQSSWQGRWQRGAMEWWTEPSDGWSSTGGVRAAGTGMMMTPASGRFYATRNGWPQLLLHRMLLPLGLVRRLRGSTCSLALVTVNKNPCFPGQLVSP